MESGARRTIAKTATAQQRQKRRESGEKTERDTADTNTEQHAENPPRNFFCCSPPPGGQGGACCVCGGAEVNERGAPAGGYGGVIKAARTGRLTIHVNRTRERQTAKAKQHPQKTTRTQQKLRQKICVGTGGENATAGGERAVFGRGTM
jgi:hypothetical protein